MSCWDLVRTASLLLVATGGPVLALPTGVERRVALVEPTLVAVTATVVVVGTWTPHDGSASQQYGPWTLTQHAEGALVAPDGRIATASARVRLADPELVLGLAEERFLLDVAAAWRADAERQGRQVDDDTLREGLRRLRRRGRLTVAAPDGGLLRPTWRIDLGDGDPVAAVAVALGGPTAPVALLRLAAPGPWPSLTPAMVTPQAGARVTVLARRPGGLPMILDGVLSRHPGVETAFATDVAIEAPLAGSAVLDAGGRWLGVALERLEGDSAFGVSWVAADSGGLLAGADTLARPLDEAWAAALEILWSGDGAAAQRAFGAVVASQPHHQAARRRLTGAAGLVEPGRRPARWRWYLAAGLALLGVSGLVAVVVIWRRRSRGAMI